MKGKVHSDSDTRDRILKASGEIFAECGYRRATARNLIFATICFESRLENDYYFTNMDKCPKNRSLADFTERRENRIFARINNIEKWEQQRHKTMEDRVMKKLRKILNTHQPPSLPEGVTEKIKLYSQKQKKNTTT